MTTPSMLQMSQHIVAMQPRVQQRWARRRPSRVRDPLQEHELRTIRSVVLPSIIRFAPRMADLGTSMSGYRSLSDRLIDHTTCLASMLPYPGPEAD